MSTPKHTPTPWRADRTDSGWRVLATDARATIVAEVTGAASNPTAEADAARIVQCVNACAGMDDPAAEVARLREIERVARELIADSYTAIGPSHPTRAPYDVAAPGRTWNALREALTPKEP